MDSLHYNTRRHRMPLFPPRTTEEAAPNTWTLPPGRNMGEPVRQPYIPVGISSGRCYTSLTFGRRDADLPQRCSQPARGPRQLAPASGEAAGVAGPVARVEQSCNASGAGARAAQWHLLLGRWYQVRCPYCGSAELLRSRSLGPWYMWLLRPVLVPIRCGRCARLFHRIRLLAFFASNVKSF